MTLYEKPVRLLFRDMLQDLEVAAGSVITRDQVLSWFRERYPNVKEATVRAYLRRLSTNHPARVNWDLQPDDDLLFRVENDTFRLYQPGSDPEPIRNPPAQGIPLTDEAELIETVRDTPEYDDFRSRGLAHKAAREERAWKLLQERRGGYTREGLSEIFDTADLAPNNQRWFGSLLAQPNRNLIFESSDEALSRWIEELLFSGRPTGEALDLCLGELKPKGVGRGLATLLLYLSNPDAHAVCVPATESGLRALKRSPGGAESSHGAAYAAFLDQALAFRKERGVEPRELDWFLTFLGGRVRPEGEGFLLKREASAGKKKSSTRYWKIAPGADAWNWEAWRDEGTITIGWEELGDLRGLSRQAFEAKRDEALQAHPTWNKVGLEQVWKFATEIREGDRIVANHGTRSILGVGTVTGLYSFVPGVRHGHRIPVAWDDTEGREVDEGGWKRTLVELDREKFEDLTTRATPPPPPTDCPFRRETFELLAGLHGEPKAAFYQARKADFQRWVEEPFQSLLKEVAARLPANVTSWLETEKKVFARILKNDYGKGGAWDFYWGAFYPQGGKRIEDAQLFASVSRDRLDFGFYIGEYGSEQRKRFLRNAKAHRAELLRLLATDLSDDGMAFGDGEAGANEELTWEGWLADPGAAGVRIGVALRAEEVLRGSREALVARVADVFEALFPLVLLATLEDPMGDVADLLVGAETDARPEYPLEQCKAETGLDVETLHRWVRAIERKRQAVLYGPPGTGKTYVAERLARHLVGGGDGFVELVQFHPTYAYEDFVQGIRPRAREDGSLDYPLVPGRFLEFCREARRRKGRCVLILDEINRANLSRVFGELMYLLEYRGNQIPLAGGERFGIPENVRLIGTMNTADRSIALVDHALRRRFAFLELYPNYEVLERRHEGKGFPVKGLVEILKRVNDQIGDRHYSLGISYFLRDDLKEQVEDIWRMEIEPYLEEYFFDQPAKAAELRWDKVKGKVLGA